MLPGAAAKLICSSLNAAACPTLALQLGVLQAALQPQPSLSVNSLAVMLGTVVPSHALLWAVQQASMQAKGGPAMPQGQPRLPGEGPAAAAAGPLATVSSISISRAAAAEGFPATALAVRAGQASLCLDAGSLAQLAALGQCMAAGPALAPAPTYPPARLVDGPGLQVRPAQPMHDCHATATRLPSPALPSAAAQNLASFRAGAPSISAAHAKRASVCIRMSLSQAQEPLGDPDVLQADLACDRISVGLSCSQQDHQQQQQQPQAPDLALDAGHCRLACRYIITWVRCCSDTRAPA